MSKVVVQEPDPNAVYTFAIACTIQGPNGTPVPGRLISGQSPVALSGGESATFTVLVGSVCTVTEASSGAATVDTAESGGAPGGSTTDGTVTVSIDATVTITNIFDPPGTLPDTGGNLVEGLLTISGLLLIIGLALASVFAARKQTLA